VPTNTGPYCWRRDRDLRAVGSIFVAEALIFVMVRSRRVSFLLGVLLCDVEIVDSWYPPFREVLLKIFGAL